MEEVKAAQLVRHLTLEQVRQSNGMELIFKTLEGSPLVRQLDKHRVDHHRRRLMQLDRAPGESVESYLTRGSIYKIQLEGLDSGLAMGEKFYVGHLLDHARLTRRDKAMVRTRAGEETEGNVVAALLELAAELEGESGYPIGVSEPNMGGQDGEEHLIQKSSSYRKPTTPKAALVTSQEEMDESLSTIAEEGNESVDEEFFPELVEAEKEAYAMQYKAKQRMAEVKKMRNFHQKKDPEERKRLLAEKIKDTHCHSCGEKGHWSRECPKNRAQQAEMEQVLRKREKQAQAVAVKKDKQALTGNLANYPSMSHRWSEEVALNIVGSARSRMVTFLWKKLLLMMRAKRAIERSSNGGGTSDGWQVSWQGKWGHCTVTWEPYATDSTTRPLWNGCE